ncbi:hypothetical protein CEP54_010404 [Fusarium duplospermum]|uniref:Uncharacterized protein n=1 Tax=Fusarium duplospermum TaxID=1325734 RepID=A0A428PK58_9HYPO|nr:hypothetical protein CEP54_010404 [Fusarium duplospermum]
MRFSLWGLATVVGVSKVSAFAITNDHQYRLGAKNKVAVDAEAKSEVNRLGCDQSRPVDPSGDGLLSADKLFSGQRAIDELVERHRPLVQIESVCYDDLGDYDDDERWQPFADISEFLKKTYPKVHEYATLETVNKYGLVYTVQGSDQSLAPILLTAHQDVVPVENETLDQWEYPPFEGHYNKEDGYLRGRGVVDKSAVTGIMYALEALLSQEEYEPSRTVIVGFGFDQECSGFRSGGAGEISKYLEEKYGRNGLTVILDGGGAGFQNLGDTLYALPAVYEKGYLDVWFDLEVLGGHSGVPTPHTSIGIMSEITTKLEANPFQPVIIRNSPIHEGLTCLARYSPRAYPALTQALRWGDLKGAAYALTQISPDSKYSIQTSQAVNSICAGNNLNSLPEVVTLGVNHRIAPQDSFGDVQYRIAYLAQDIARKYNLKFSAFQGDRDYMEYLDAKGIAPQSEDTSNSQWPPQNYNGKLTVQARDKSYVTPASPTSGAIWDLFAGTVRHTFARQSHNVVVAPGTMTGNTDTRHYLNLSRNIYRWSPMSLRSFGNIHTINDRLLMSEHVDMVRFYYDFVRNFDKDNEWDIQMKRERKDL